MIKLKNIWSWIKKWFVDIQDTLFFIGSITFLVSVLIGTVMAIIKLINGDYSFLMLIQLGILVGIIMMILGISILEISNDDDY